MIEDGFYWVKYSKDDDWVPAEWSGVAEGWLLIGEDIPCGGYWSGAAPEVIGDRIDFPDK